MSSTDIKRIFLCGFMGTGKSTLGKRLARSMEKPFIDLDDVIVRKLRLAIPKIFQLYGESYFRKLEKETINEIIFEDEGVIALGGGALQDKEVIQGIKANGLLVFIETPFEELFRRLLRNKKRPLLLDKDGKMKDNATLKQDLSNLYNKRLPYYREAHITFRGSEDGNLTEQAALLKERICEYEQST